MSQGTPTWAGRSDVRLGSAPAILARSVPAPRSLQCTRDPAAKSDDVDVSVGDASVMTTKSTSRPRDARAEDVDRLIPLWGLLFDEAPQETRPWRDHARVWFGDVVINRQVACFPVVEVGTAIVACAVGTLELGVPNPHCPRGRTARLANVVTLPEHRRQGHATALVDFVVQWARSIQADRVDLSATPEGQRIYARSGFALTSAPRMKLVL